MLLKGIQRRVEDKIGPKMEKNDRYAICIRSQVLFGRFLIFSTSPPLKHRSNRDIRHLPRLPTQPDQICLRHADTFACHLPSARAPR